MRFLLKGKESINALCLKIDVILIFLNFYNMKNRFKSSFFLLKSEDKTKSSIDFGRSKPNFQKFHLAMSISGMSVR